jgi:hypothetical protein
MTHITVVSTVLLLSVCIDGLYTCGNIRVIMHTACIYVHIQRLLPAMSVDSVSSYSTRRASNTRSRVRYKYPPRKRHDMQRAAVFRARSHGQQFEGGSWCLLIPWTKPVHEHLTVGYSDTCRSMNCLLLTIDKYAKFGTDSPWRRKGYGCTSPYIHTC